MKSGNALIATVALAFVANRSLADKANDAIPPALTIEDERGKTHAFFLTDLENMPRQTLKVPMGDGKVATHEGVLLADLMTRSGVPLGKELKGPRVASYVLLKARDGYRVLLALPEVDPATSDKVILLADRRDANPLDEKEGPLRLIIAGEKRPVRWIKMVESMRIHQAP
jgi:hypothetical protein